MSRLPPFLRGSRLVVRLFALAVFAFVGVQLYRFDPVYDPYEEAGLSEPLDATLPAAPPVRRRVRSGIFRPWIVPLEKALYKLEAKRDDGWAVEIRAKDLADKLLESRNDEAQTRAGVAVSRFAGIVGRAMDGYRGPDWPAWRKQWEGIRREHFQHADFFATYDPMGVPIAPPRGTVSQTDRAAVSQINLLIPEVQTAARRALTEALKIQEPPGAFRNTVDGQRRDSSWRAWATAWDKELDSLYHRHNPVLDAAADPRLVKAEAEVDSAFARFRPPRSASGELVFLTRYNRRLHFDSALVRLHRTRDMLSRVGSP